MLISTSSQDTAIQRMTGRILTGALTSAVTRNPAQKRRLSTAIKIKDGHLSCGSWRAQERNAPCGPDIRV